MAEPRGQEVISPDGSIIELPVVAHPENWEHTWSDHRNPVASPPAAQPHRAPASVLHATNSVAHAASANEILQRIEANASHAVASAWNFVAGDDINTLRDPKASALAKTLAGADIAVNAIPEVGEDKMLIEGAAKVVGKAMASPSGRRAISIASSRVAAGVKAQVFSAGNVKRIGRQVESVVEGAQRSGILHHAWEDLRALGDKALDTAKPGGRGRLVGAFIAGTAVKWLWEAGANGYRSVSDNLQHYQDIDLGRANARETGRIIQLDRSQLVLDTGDRKLRYNLAQLAGVLRKGMDDLGSLETASALGEQVTLTKRDGRFEVTVGERKPQERGR